MPGAGQALAISLGPGADRGPCVVPCIYHVPRCEAACRAIAGAASWGRRHSRSPTARGTAGRRTMRGSRGRVALLAGAAVLVTVVAAGAVTAIAGRDRPAAAFSGGTVNPATAPVPPAHGAYFGARVRPLVDTEPAAIAAVRNLQGEIGRRLDIVHVFHLWGDPFPSRSDLAFL